MYVQVLMISNKRPSRRASSFQSPREGRSNNYIPINKHALIDDDENDICVGRIHYILVVDNYLPLTPDPPPTLRLAICDLFEVQRIKFSPPGTGMWTAREGSATITNDVPIDIETHILEKLVYFNFKHGLATATYETHNIQARTMRWSTYV